MRPRAAAPTSSRSQSGTRPTRRAARGWRRSTTERRPRQERQRSVRRRTARGPRGSGGSEASDGSTVRDRRWSAEPPWLPVTARRGSEGPTGRAVRQSAGVRGSDVAVALERPDDQPDLADVAAEDLVGVRDAAGGAGSAAGSPRPATRPAPRGSRRPAGPVRSARQVRHRRSRSSAATRSRRSGARPSRGGRGTAGAPHRAATGRWCAQAGAVCRPRRSTRRPGRRAPGRSWPGPARRAGAGLLGALLGRRGACRGPRRRRRFAASSALVRGALGRASARSAVPPRRVPRGGALRGAADRPRPPPRSLRSLHRPPLTPPPPRRQARPCRLDRARRPARPRAGRPPRPRR